ncbi:hypothetical protein [Sphaerisporangium sp. TRM90804]|uniref:hypothetical protein n=1 Tax=Sphaerisporangium sp. TRM90804 TaxID=3031113 RepID=UPI00244CE303|nr:hypothetical protein [Sphaerisporangium sp. TRM90804]MDH2428406.1 hypothetical protein [Sphaerisporangium sp. TRM90804]
MKYAHATLLVFAGVLSFFGVKSAEEWGLSGQSATVWVTDAANVPAPQVVETVTTVARAHGATVARMIPDLRHPDSRRHLYLVVGDPESSSAAWPTEGFPAFSRDMRTVVHRIGEITGRDPRGFYQVFGPPEAGQALHGAFVRLGLTSEITPEPGLAGLIAYVGAGALSLIFLTVGLSVMVTVGSCVLLNSKAYGVLRLCGMSFSEILARDMRQLATFWLSTFGVVTAASLIFLGFYNGLDRFTLFALTAAGVWSTLGLLAIATHAVAIGLTFQTAILRTLKGELAARSTMVCAYLVRGPAILLAFVVGLSCVHAGQEVLDRQDGREAYAEVGDASTIRLGGSFTREAEEEVVAKVGRWIRQADRDGKIILLHPSLAPQKVPQVPNVLIVNQTFLAEQPVLDPAGRPHGPWPRNEERLRFIVPAPLAPYAPSIRAAVLEELSPGDEATARIAIDTLPARPGQAVFTYGAFERLGRKHSVLADPVLVVIPNGSAIVSDDAYTASASHDEVVFKDSQHVREALRDPELGGMVVALTSVAEQFADEYRKAVHEFRLSVAALVVALIVLLVAGIGVSIVYARKNAQAVFVKHISGWRFAATYRALLGAESLLLMLPLAWTAWQAWDVRREMAMYTAAGLPAPPRLQPPEAWETILAGGMTGLGVLMVLGVLTAFHRRIVREGTAAA